MFQRKLVVTTVVIAVLVVLSLTYDVDRQRARVSLAAATTTTKSASSSNDNGAVVRKNKSNGNDDDDNNNNDNSNGRNGKAQPLQSDEWRRDEGKGHIKWPQKDNSIIEAIQKGVYINNVNQTWPSYVWNETKYEAPPPNLSTVVVAYYDMPSKHPQSLYKKWFRLMLQATDPMVIFLNNPNSHWWQFVIDSRQHAPTIVVHMPFNNITMATSFHEEFWSKEVKSRDGSKVTGRKKLGNGMYKIWNQKIIFLHETARLNPFNTEQFMWVDAGYFRRGPRSPRRSPIVRNNVTANGAGRNQVVLQQVLGEPSYEIAAGVWGGTFTALQAFYDRYWETFWHMVVTKTDCVAKEQRVFVWLCKSFPEVCALRRSTDKDWFAMGYRWLRTNTSSFASTVLIPHNATSEGPLVISPIQLPNDTVIFSSKAMSET